MLGAEITALDGEDLSSAGPLARRATDGAPTSFFGNANRVGAEQRTRASEVREFNCAEGVRINRADLFEAGGGGRGMRSVVRSVEVSLR